MRSMAMVRREVNRLYGKLKNWRTVGAEMGISGGMAYRIGVDGYEPKEPAIRVKLGLPGMAPAPVCLRCGVVHVTKRCCASRARRGKDLFEMGTEELAWRLVHRVNVDLVGDGCK